MIQAGAGAPDFSLDSETGERLSLSAGLKAGPILVVFFKVGCPTCQLTLPFLGRVQVRTLGVSQDKPPATQDFKKRFGIAFPTLIDPAEGKYPVSNAYRITNVPSLFLVEPDRRISWAIHGFHKAELEWLASRFGATLFRAGDQVPAMRPG